MSHPKGCYGCGRKRCSAGPSWKPERNTPPVYSLTEGLLVWQAAMEDELMAMDVSKGAAHNPGHLFVDEEMCAEHPDLYAFMRETVWSDGKKRSTGTLTISVEGRVIKCSTHDRDGKRYFWLTGDTLKGLLASIDRALRDDTAEWRPDKR